MEIVPSKTVSTPSQDIGNVEHNTVAYAHKRSHEIADRIAAKHDVHSFKQDIGSRVFNTSSVGEELGTNQDGRDEATPVEKTGHKK